MTSRIIYVGYLLLVIHAIGYDGARTNGIEISMFYKTSLFNHLSFRRISN